MSRSGLLVIDKPPSWTSRRVVDEVQRLVRPAKAGHAGTLDPLATGVLVVGIGAGTRLVSDVQSLAKTYLATFQLGATSDTEDAEGTITPGAACDHVTDAMIEAGLQKQVGSILQRPPNYSALHVQGQRAYDLARRGETFELPPRPVEVLSAKLLRRVGPYIHVKIECGSGVYVRSIGRDLGESLGCGALMTALQRTAIGPFTIDHALAGQEISLLAIQKSLKPLAIAVAHLPRIDSPADDARRLRLGQKLPVAGLAPGRYAVFEPAGGFVAIAEVRAHEGVIRPQVVFPLD